MPIQSVAVFCGSKFGNNLLYTKHAKTLGKLIANKNIQLIYGGGQVGLMGIIANAVLENNGKVCGIIPVGLAKNEIQHQSLTKLIITSNMHDRKKLIYKKCQAAIALPGGYGTLDEVFEFITWNQLGIHQIPIFILNSGGYYNFLIKQINEMYLQKFIDKKGLNLIKFVTTPNQVMKYF